MNSMIYRGKVTHARLSPVQHNFRYPVYFYAFDLDELPDLARNNPLFGYNQLRPVAIHDKDYLRIGTEPIRVKLEQTLREQGINTAVGKVMLVTSARYFNYIFNPVSFFYCYTRDEELLCIVAQVNNTFGEMHLYLLSKPEDEAANGQLVYLHPKQFHVSPFFTREGHYKFLLTEATGFLDNQINFYQDETLVIIARLQGQSEPLTPRNLLRTIIRHPLSAALTMPRILWQAAKLYWQRRLPVHNKPVPDHSMTIRPVAPSFLDRIGMILCFKFLSRLSVGQLQVRLPDGSLHLFGNTKDQSPQQLSIHEYRFFRRVMFSGEIGFGEAFTAGDWTTENLPSLLTLLANNEQLVDDRGLLTATLGRWINYLRHQLRANTIKGSSRNIREHYDLSNDFFATFLDPSMTYSSALFKSETEGLSRAQVNKIQTIIDKAGISKNDHVLEIGCGWGSFAIQAVQQTGCRVTGITLSHEQLALAQQRVQDAGLEDQIDLQLRDYRHIEGQYDKIVSIEMLEAVGHAGLQPFFTACDKALLPGGKAVIQVITIPDSKYNAYRYSSDWIRKHIFPGGHLPSIGVLAKSLTASSKLRINSLEQHGLDYGKTLDIWRQTFLEKRLEILALGYDKNFLRTWEYYFAFCQAGFDAQIIDLTQLVVEKAKHV
ncbi:DUF1365 family protein [uncultured Desulfuromusa sp.]|uniref:DUF1365 family protein n=1 Tax=uncultured Desulfuromusa sp. TaxID=219183 RepID=UPI002AA8179C|nr:DUF1365 family protein [uncultured Desulfuromusa sp.]